MKKSNLKNGMVVEYRNGERRIVINDKILGLYGHNEFKYYNDDLTSVTRDELDIVKVFKSQCISLVPLLSTDRELDLLWEREPVVDWSKIPFGTEVECWDDEGEIYTGRYLEFNGEEETYPHLVFVDKYSATLWEHCRLVKEHKYVE